MSSNDFSASPTISLWLSDDLIPVAYQLNTQNKKSLDNSSIKKAKFAVSAMYLLIALTALQRKCPSKKLFSLINNIDQATKHFYLIYDKIKKTAWKQTGWAYFFFRDHPRNFILELSPKESLFSVGFMPNVTVKLYEDQTNRELEIEEIEKCIESFLELIDQSIHIDLCVISGQGTFRKIDNRNYSGKLLANESLKIKVQSNHPTYFLVLWITPLGSMIRVHPNLHKNEGFENYANSFRKLSSGSRVLISPSNNNFKIDVNSGMATCVVLSQPREFNETISEIQDRFQILIANKKFHNSATDWSFYEKKLEKELRPRMKIDIRFGLLPNTSLSEWISCIEDQMHGLADRIDLLFIPQNPISLPSL